MTKFKNFATLALRTTNGLAVICDNTVFMLDSVMNMHLGNATSCKSEYGRTFRTRKEFATFMNGARGASYSSMNDNRHDALNSYHKGYCGLYSECDTSNAWEKKCALQNHKERMNHLRNRVQLP